MSLPTGLDGAYRALTSTGGDSYEASERLTTLLWLRILTDPTAPLIGGNDPRTILTEPLTWEEVTRLGPALLCLLCGRLNDVMGEKLLHQEWLGLPAETFARAVKEIGRWQLPAGDPLGVAFTLLMSESAQSAKGAFYTPYHVSLMMATMVTPSPGESVCDPCCGSGGMLLAALEAVRAQHGPDAYLEVYGTDIDAGAIRLCKLNITLAGIAPARRVWKADALEEAPPALARARQEYEQSQLGLFD